MSDMKNQYKKILEELENNIKDPKDLIFVKEKFMDLTLIFMDIIDRLTILTDTKIKEIEEKQQAIDNKIKAVKSMVDEIEGDIYEDEESYEFEIVCPYCNYEFTTDIADEEKEEVKCPKCNNIIELDWNADEEQLCDGNCSHCHEEKVAEEEAEYNVKDKKKNSKKKEEPDENKEENKNEDEDM